MDIFEREQLEKKKTEIFEVTKHKLLAVRVSLEETLLNHPHLIGCIPNVEQQISVAFDCWLNKHKQKIRMDEAVKNNFELFLEQLNIIKMEPTEWNNFLSTWKLNRIMYDDKFTTVWMKMKQSLNLHSDSMQIEEDESNINVDQQQQLVAQNPDKREIDANE